MLYKQCYYPVIFVTLLFVTILQTITHAASQFTDSTTPVLDAEVLLGYVLQKDRSWLHAHVDDVLTNEQAESFSNLTLRRSQSEPLAYIIGKQEFYGRMFAVNKHVLVPRPETEAFLELLQSLLETEKVHTLLDIGTGSGNLAITAKLEFPSLFVTATDISSSALKVAATNCLALKAAVKLKKQSLLTGDKEGYDVIVANLPYVPTTMKNISIAREPSEALFSGPDGLDHYRELFAQLAPKHIRFVMTEALLNQHAELTKVAGSAGYKQHATNGLVQLFYKTTDASSLTEAR